MDKIEKYKETLIHHGDYNDRMYILKFPGEGDKDLVREITGKAISNNYSKVVAKVPKSKLTLFLTTGYKLETTIPRYYKGKEDCCFVSRFLTTERAVFDPEPLEKFEQVLSEYKYTDQKTTQGGTLIRELTEEDAPLMAEVYKQVFETYPFPIFNTDYLIETMRSHVLYVGAFQKNKLIGIASSEMDVQNQNAEMTDFAMLPESRGLGLSKVLLGTMEQNMKDRNMKTLYTMARLNSIPMNKTFLSAGYNYAGTLINNTNIAGGIESLNILYKFLSYEG